ncbi:hypothetical protein Aca07nite_01540 [Actinoplanes capillaceus]|uniref:SnoaL-like polyketide cyclase n=1 Tax=Actinoplanes campanulatus TaxID=113559 RepID=A0ABQ3W8F3_9ACTN|nr:ester cyclase [Actinoplanes capillaceus]GID42879.1 hypothetical protein Aca07nite_01540 [Actinoplanes capillaceus]
MSTAVTTLDQENVALVRRVTDAVNARRYDDMDELFAPNFVDHNPAWNVDSLQALKGLLAVAQEALDFRAGLDALYAADGGRVIMQITFTGRHVAPIFGIHPTGLPVSWTSIEVYRLENHKIVERWVQADTTGLMRQVGVLMPD